MEAFKQHLQQTIQRQNSFEQAAQVVEGAIAAIATSNQLPIESRISVLNELEQLIRESTEKLVDQTGNAKSQNRFLHANPSDHMSFLSNSLEPSSSYSIQISKSVTNSFKCPIFGIKDIGKSAWINQAKMLLETFSNSTPDNPGSKEILYKSHSGQQIQFSLYEITPSISQDEQENLRSGSHATFIMYDSSNEASVRYAESLVSSWSSRPQILILINNRPPSGESRYEPRIKSADYIVISTAKKGNIAAPLQLATRRLLNDPLFSFDLKLKTAELTSAGSIMISTNTENGTTNTPSTSISSSSYSASASAPNPATIAAAAAATTRFSSSTILAKPASWNAKRSSAASKPSSKHPMPPQPLSPYAAWELEHRSAIRKKYPSVSSVELDRKLSILWKSITPVEREKYGVLALKAQRLFAEGLSRELGLDTSKTKYDSDDDDW